MCSAYLQQFSLPPISSESFPMASQSHMIKLVGQDNYVEVERAEVRDIAFVLPIFEVESGWFNMSGSYNSFFTWYLITNGAVEQYIPKYYFILRVIEPFSICLFHSLNTLVGLLKKSFYHIGEAESCIHTFQLFFNTEAFCYLYHKLSTFSFVHSKERKGTVVMYHDTLKMECRTSSLRVVTKVGLSMLRQVLGAGVGLGLTK